MYENILKTVSLLEMISLLDGHFKRFGTVIFIRYDLNKN
jgi:hypothetical protein